MIDIRLMRIDDRLIHGQITSTWIADLGVDIIVVIDNDTLNDELKKMMLELATPPNIILKIFGVEKAIEFLQGHENHGRALVLIKNPAHALELVKGGIFVKSINIGNLSMEPSKRNIYKSIWVSQKDINIFKELDCLGIELEVRVVPNDRPIPFFSLIKERR